MRGKPLIHHIYGQLSSRFDEILISTNEPGKHAFLGARTVPDRVPGKGPLMGIASAVEAARHERVFVTACDIPVIDLDTVARMLVLAEDFDCVIPMSSVGHEPLFAVYRKSASRPCATFWRRESGGSAPCSLGCGRTSTTLDGRPGTEI